MGKILVTGATGFIGMHLVKRLADQGHEVICLVRSTSNRRKLQSLKARIDCADLSAPETYRDRLKEVDAVFNLAGVTKAIRRADFVSGNVQAARLLAQTMSSLSTSAPLIHISSLAAAGSSGFDQQRVEGDPPQPVSQYGSSKLDGERAIAEFAKQLPISIVRPPIVIGPGDQDGFEMYKSIARIGVHVVPSLRDHQFSLIHVLDLCDALVNVLEHGQRLDREGTLDKGVYFAADDTTPTYAELGSMIGRSLGRESVRLIRCPAGIIWPVAAFNQLWAKLRQRPHILNLDKIREAAAGSWTCSADRLKRETGFQISTPLQNRLDQTARWYIENGWLGSQTALGNTDDRIDT